MELVCKKCGYVWNTNSKARRISCSKCKTSITIHTPQHKLIRSEEEAAKARIERKREEAIEIPVHPPVQTPAGKTINKVKFPLSLWKDFRLRQQIDHAPSLGEDHIVLKVDKDGILYL